MCTESESIFLINICCEEGMPIEPDNFIFCQVETFYDDFCKIKGQNKELHFERFRDFIKKIKELPNELLASRSSDSETGKMERFFDIFNSGNSTQIEQIEDLIFNC